MLEHRAGLFLLGCFGLCDLLDDCFWELRKEFVQVVPVLDDTSERFLGNVEVCPSTGEYFAGGVDGDVELFPDFLFGPDGEDAIERDFEGFDESGIELHKSKI